MCIPSFRRLLVLVELCTHWSTLSGTKIAPWFDILFCLFVWSTSLIATSAYLILGPCSLIGLWMPWIVANPRVLYGLGIHNLGVLLGLNCRMWTNCSHVKSQIWFVCQKTGTLTQPSVVNKGRHWWMYISHLCPSVLWIWTSNHQTSLLLILDFR